MADWRSLPRDLVGKISGRLESSIDLLRFRSVCSSWRSFTDPPSSTPRSIRFDGLESRTRYGLTKRTVFLVSPPDSTTPSCWIVKFKAQDNGSKRLLSPFSRYPLNSLPPNFPRPFDFINFRIRELGEEHVLHVRKLGSPKTVVYRNKVAVVWINEGSDFLLLTTDLDSHKLAFYSSVERKWTVFEDEPYYSDVMAHNGKLYALDSNGNVVCVSPSAQLDLIATCNFRGYRRVLVESRGQLLLVFLDSDRKKVRDRREPIFQCVWVFKVDEESRSCIPVHSLDGQVLFLGTDLTFSAADVPGCSGNLMFFIDDDSMSEITRLEAGYLLGVDIAVLEWGTGSAKLLSACPDYAKMFWPPPDWLSSALLEPWRSEVKMILKIWSSTDKTE